jgi:anti-sigma factor RsiW
MMDCLEVRDRLEPLALGFLEPEEARDCEAHLAVCDACRTRQVELGDLIGLLGRLGAPAAAPAGLEARILARTAAAPPPVRLRARAGLAAAAGLLVAAGLAAAGYQAGLRAAPRPGDAVATRLDAQQRRLDEIRSELAALRASDARRTGEGAALVRVQAEIDRQRESLAALQEMRRDADAEKAATDRRIKDLEKQLTDTVSQLALLRDQTIDTFLKVASAVSNPLVRN